MSFHAFYIPHVDRVCCSIRLNNTRYLDFPVGKFVVDMANLTSGYDEINNDIVAGDWVDEQLKISDNPGNTDQEEQLTHNQAAFLQAMIQSVFLEDDSFTELNLLQRLAIFCNVSNVLSNEYLSIYCKRSVDSNVNENSFMHNVHEEYFFNNYDSATKIIDVTKNVAKEIQKMQMKLNCNAISTVEVYSIWALIVVDIQTMIDCGVTVKRCKNCGKYFIPTSRSDEIYCDNLYKTSGRTCKQVGYENKVLNNEILREYRKIYKTQNARKQRNSHIPQIAERFKAWTEFARKQLESCQNGEQSLDSMVAAISGDSWMKEGALNADNPETR